MVRSRLGALALPATAGAAVGFAGWLVGVVPADAVLVGVLITAVLVLPRWVGLPESFHWPGAPDDVSAGGWYEIRRLATAVQHPDDRREVFAVRLAPSLRAIAEGKLARLGMAWSVPAASRLLGPDVHALLDDPVNAPLGRRPAMELAELVLGRLDEIPDEPHH
jgi:hypothetical protein